MAGRARGETPHHVDIHVGRRLRALRKQSGLSLGVLAEKVGVAYQQLHKYETGVNRMSASMLYDLADALGAPVTAFYIGLPNSGSDQPTDPGLAARVDAVLATPGGRDLLDAFLQMPQHLRRQLAALASGITRAKAPETPVGPPTVRWAALRR